MVTLRRWCRAQENERDFWKKLARDIETGTVDQLDWYQWRATQLGKRLSSLSIEDSSPSAAVLEVGSGPIGIVNFLQWQTRFAVDPLEDFYKQNPTLTKLRRPGVTHLKGTGEGLPFPDNFFSLVIIDNVIDHTRSPDKVLHEIYRVLRENGLLYLAVNVYMKWGEAIHKVLAALSIDSAHPHTFTRDTVQELLARSCFAICKEELDDYRVIRQKNRRSQSLRERLKACTGLTEFEYNVICQKILAG